MVVASPESILIHLNGMNCIYVLAMCRGKSWHLQSKYAIPLVSSNSSSTLRCMGKLLCFSSHFSTKDNYNKTSMAQTPLEPRKYVQDRGSECLS